MCRWSLILGVLLSLALGPCALACGLTATTTGDACCAVGADDEPCPASPEPVCACAQADGVALPPGIVAVPQSQPAQETPVATVVVPPMATVYRQPITGARAPPGLAALRSVILLI